MLPVVQNKDPKGEGDEESLFHQTTSGLHKNVIFNHANIPLNEHH
jgi:hypothetical protein